MTFTISLSHVLGGGLLIDVSSLCDFLEYLCGCIAVADVYNRASTLHSITLPRSWLLRILPDFDSASYREVPVGLILSMIDRIPSVLETFFTGITGGKFFKCTLSENKKSHRLVSRIATVSRQGCRHSWVSHKADFYSPNVRVDCLFRNLLVTHVFSDVVRCACVSPTTALFIRY
jgi:hypothetical protein